MPKPVWRVEFDRAADRDLRKLGSEAERLITRYLRERIATADDPRRFGHALTGDRKGYGATASGTIVSSPRSRTTASWCWWSRLAIGARFIGEWSSPAVRRN